MKRFVTIAIIAVSFLSIFIRFGKEPLLSFFGFQEKAGVNITSLPEATVFIDGEEVGKTPYRNEDLKVKEYEIKLVAGESFWQSGVRLNAGTLSVINRELSPSVASSSGEILTLQKGKGVIIVSVPGMADVEVDGKPLGKTPLLVGDLTTSEHTFTVSKNNYLKRVVRASLPEGMALRLSVDLALAENEAIVPLIPTVEIVKKVIVKQTPNGFLRVRATPSTTSREVGRVSGGDSLMLVEDLNNWVKIKMDNNTEGYVSSLYIQK